MSIPEALARVSSRLADLERRVAGMVVHGKVAEVDPAAGTVRLEIGRKSDGSPLIGPAVPYAQMAGALKIHAPPSVGQAMTAVSPSGDARQAVALPTTWSGANPSPSSAGDQNVLTFGDVTISLAAGGVVLSVGGFVVEISGDGIAAAGGKITHDGLNVGSTHRHTGVMPGPSNTGGPL